MRKAHVAPAFDRVALHPEGVDRNDLHVINRLVYDASPSTRRAWIEMPSWVRVVSSATVALHPEGVDRNIEKIANDPETPVALHPEGVDRNILLM